jgi:hypothetical protein
MSKESEAKQAQWYFDKAIPQTCGTCHFYQSTVTITRGASGIISRFEMDKRCKLGGFAVNKKGTCKRFHQRNVEAETGSLSHD